MGNQIISPGHRPPRIRAWTFTALPLHLPCLLSHRVLSSLADSPQGVRPFMQFLNACSQFCTQFTMHSYCAGASSRLHLTVAPCRQLVVYAKLMLNSGSATGDFHPMSPCQCRAYQLGAVAWHSAGATCQPLTNDVRRINK